MSDGKAGTILILEDEFIIAADLEDVLRQSGFQNFATFATVADAEQWLATSSPEFAIIDPHLRDDISGHVALQLGQRNIPFMVYSGDYAAGQMIEALRGGVWLAKPATPEQLKAAVSVFLEDTSGKL